MNSVSRPASSFQSSLGNKPSKQGMAVKFADSKCVRPASDYFSGSKIRSIVNEG